MDCYSVLATILTFRLNRVVSAFVGNLALRAETTHDLLEPVPSLGVFTAVG
jgi:hypothetical protein